ncbi:hypothetical protein AAT19DRAFT_11852 [Rhodotorula toruloides]|uniref:Uncharacterized protein n=1 Tax=Rhodotorula toruloides TaxID=5286 RepID=A0A2S9ZVQ1_RHOTO|nr:hypothetical protein AAT19DRAFT_11852 [Rhodotorula toruloides]
MLPHQAVLTGRDVDAFSSSSSLAPCFAVRSSLPFVSCARAPVTRRQITESGLSPKTVREVLLLLAFLLLLFPPTSARRSASLAAGLRSCNDAEHRVDRRQRLFATFPPFCSSPLLLSLPPHPLFPPTQPHPPNPPKHAAVSPAHLLTGSVPLRPAPPVLLLLALSPALPFPLPLSRSR